MWTIVNAADDTLFRNVYSLPQKYALATLLINSIKYQIFITRATHSLTILFI
jgi:hypothetical protein